MSTGARKAVVTGAASGIGLAVARRLLANDIAVVGTDVNETGLADLQREGAQTVTADISDLKGRSAVVQFAGEVDYLVNAAGIVRVGPIREVALDEWRSLFAVNVESIFFLMQAFVPMLRPGGAVVNIASTAAKTSPPEFAAYSASKAAVLSITRSFATQLALRSIRVNAVSPGIIDTPMQNVFLPYLAAAAGMTQNEFQADRLTQVPLRRIGSPEDVAAVIYFLLTDGSSYVTGEDINVAGGLVTW